MPQRHTDSQHNPRDGFTLVEMAIVLVIIGLLVGGILVGRDLIHVAELRSTISDVEKLKTAIRTFQIKYNCLPGDCINATDYFPGVANGNGDGNYLPWGGESGWAGYELDTSQLWHQLHPEVGADPRLAVRGSSSTQFAYLFTNDLYDNGNGANALYGRWGNTITLGAVSDVCYAGVVMTSLDAYSIDSKMDDGQPTTGAVFGVFGDVASTAPGSCAININCTAAGAYVLNDPTYQCRMIFYWP